MYVYWCTHTVKKKDRGAVCARTRLGTSTVPSLGVCVRECLRIFQGIMYHTHMGRWLSIHRGHPMQTPSGDQSTLVTTWAVQSTLTTTHAKIHNDAMRPPISVSILLTTDVDHTYGNHKHNAHMAYTPHRQPCSCCLLVKAAASAHARLHGWLAMPYPYGITAPGVCMMDELSHTPHPQ